MLALLISLIAMQISNQTSQINTQQSDGLIIPTWILAYATIGLALAVSFFSWYQRRLLQTEMTMRLRPWISRNNFIETNTLEKEGYLYIFEFKNYGQLPAKSMYFATYASDEKPSRLQAQINRSEASMVMAPNEILKFRFHIQKDLVDDGKSGKRALFLLVYTTYEYANNRKGGYGIIARFDTTSNEFVYIDSWIK